MSNSTPTPLIATLESFLSPSIPTHTSQAAPAIHLLPPSTLSRLKNLGQPRARDMRTLSHTTQIISHLPIPACPQTCAKLNDALDAGIRMQSDKMAALALLPGGEGQGKDAARELQRCVVKLKFVGGIVAVGRAGEGILDAGFEEVWGTAVKFGVPIVVRGVWPTDSEITEYTQGLPDSVVAPLVTHMHTAHIISPIPILRLYFNGVFDHYPSLRLVLAHPGSLPSFLPRIETMLDSIPDTDKPKRSFLDVWQHNVYLTTADALDLSSMRMLLEQIPIDRVLYASNYPLEERGKELMTKLRESDFLTEEEWERLAWRNAEQLFKLKGGERGPYNANTKTIAKPRQHALLV